MESFSITPPLPNCFQLVIAPKAARQAMLHLAAKLALEGPLRIFDGGNHTNVYVIAKHIRRFTPLVDESLEHIRVARAFTCYQILHLLSSAPVEQQPLLMLDLLATFYDENVSLQKAQHLLNRVLHEIERFRGKVPLVISVRSTVPDLERSVLLEQLAAKADRVIILKLSDPSQPSAPESQLTFPF
jgi:hypothetical protein